MDASVDGLWPQIERERQAAPAVAPGLELEEIHTSTALAGSALSGSDVAALVDEGRVPGGQSLRDCIMAADYANAAAFVRRAPAVGNRQGFVRVDEIVALHARALGRSPEARPGVWRRTTAPPGPSGVVASPAWLIARDVGTFADRFATGPPVGANPLRWVAEAHGRFARIHPFSAGNGRVTRLACNLLLRRLGLPPLIVRAHQRASYEAARRTGEVRRLEPLAALIGRSLLDSYALMADSGDAAGERLRSLGSFAQGPHRAALYKAAQRGRLRTLRRGSALLTTEAWIADYLNRKHR